MYITVSLTSASFDKLGKVVEEIDKSDADAIHIDITDGSLFPALVFPPKAIKDLRPYTKKTIDVHLGTVNPTWLIDQVAQAGADACSIQWDNCEFPRYTLDHIHRLGMKGGVVITPKSDIPDMTYARDLFDFVILQTVEPIPSYQFLPFMAEKLKHHKSLERNKGITWFMDGDVNFSNLDVVTRSGVDALVIGSLITGAPNIPDRVKEVKERILEIQKSM